MPVQRFSPQGLAQPVPYHHVAVATGARHVHVAGQVAQLAERSLVAGGDVAGHIAQSLRNPASGLAAAGASFDDVVRLTVYVTDWELAKYEQFLAGVEQVAGEIGLALPMPPASLIGVSQLFTPEILVEIEATAVVA